MAGKAPAETTSTLINRPGHSLGPQLRGRNTCLLPMKPPPGSELGRGGAKGNGGAPKKVDPPSVYSGTATALRAAQTVRLTGRPSGGKWHRYPCPGRGPWADAEGGRPSRARRTAACPPSRVAAGRGGGRGRRPVGRGRGGVAAGARQAAVGGSGCRLGRRAGSAWLQGRASARARARPRLRSAPAQAGAASAAAPAHKPRPARPAGGAYLAAAAAAGPGLGRARPQRRLREPQHGDGGGGRGCGSGGGAGAGAGLAAGPGWGRGGVGGGGRRLGPGRPAQGGVAERLPQPQSGPGLSPLAFGLPPPVPGGLRGTDPTAAGGAGEARGRNRTPTSRTRARPAGSPASPAQQSTRSGTGPAAALRDLGLSSSDAPPGQGRGRGRGLPLEGHDLPTRLCRPSGGRAPQELRRRPLPSDLALVEPSRQLCER